MITPGDYELALLEKLRLEFAGSAIRVLGTDNNKEHKIHGRYSFVPRQLDVAAYRLGEARPFLIADAKRHSTKLDVKDVEAFIGMVEDVGAEIGLIVAPAGFTKAATQRAASSSIHIRVMSIEQALTFKWLPLAREIYPYDWAFHEELSHAVRRLHEKALPAVIIEAIGTVPFEEWDSFVAYALAHHQCEAVFLLQTIAADHFEGGWRFNAIQHLLESNSLGQQEIKSLLATEEDSDIRELLT